MYAMKASWVGQTFALAASSDSGGRKARIRRSKEERKAMVESFIKRYQTLNDGNFPSLNLTHKEVGGSFYTVRELVREIIQENKVLGPAKFSGELQQDRSIAEDYSLGSSSSEVQVLLSVNELSSVPKYQENDSVGVKLDDNDHCTKHQDQDPLQCSSGDKADEISEGSAESRKSVNESDGEYVSLEPCLDGQSVDKNLEDDAQLVVNGSRSNSVSKESDEMLGERSLVSEISEGNRGKELVGAYNAELTLPTKELEVETFPLRPAVKEIDDLDITSTVSGNVNIALNNLGTKHNEISNGIPHLDKFGSPDSISEMVAEKGADGSQRSAAVPDIVSQQAEINNKNIQHEEVNNTNKTLEMLDSSAIKDESLALGEGCVDKVASHSGSTSNTFDKSEEDGFQSKNAPKGVTHVENSSKVPVSAAGNGSYVRRESRGVGGASPTVDRIDLGSWESKNSSNQENNPLLAFFKAFVDAFAKFWSR